MCLSQFLKKRSGHFPRSLPLVLITSSHLIFKGLLEMVRQQFV